MTAPCWTLVELGANRIRYRENPGYRCASGFRYSVEFEAGGEWWPVRDWDDRHWFAVGFAAGQQAPMQEEMKL